MRLLDALPKKESYGTVPRTPVVASETPTLNHSETMDECMTSGAFPRSSTASSSKSPSAQSLNETTRYLDSEFLGNAAPITERLIVAATSQKSPSGVPQPKPSAIAQEMPSKLPALASPTQHVSRTVARLSYGNNERSEHVSGPATSQMNERDSYRIFYGMFGDSLLPELELRKSSFVGQDRGKAVDNLSVQSSSPQAPLPEVTATLDGIMQGPGGEKHADTKGQFPKKKPGRKPDNRPPWERPTRRADYEILKDRYNTVQPWATGCERCKMRKWPCKLDPKNRICCLSCKLDKIKCTLKLDTSKSCGEVTGANGLDDHGQLLTRRYCDPTSDIDSQSDFDEYIVEMTLTTTTSDSLCTTPTRATKRRSISRDCIVTQNKRHRSDSDPSSTALAAQFPAAAHHAGTGTSPKDVQCFRHVDVHMPAHLEVSRGTLRAGGLASAAEERPEGYPSREIGTAISSVFQRLVGAHEQIELAMQDLIQLKRRMRTLR